MDLEKIIKEKSCNSADIVYRDVDVENEKIKVIYAETLIDSAYISEFVIQSIKRNITEEAENVKLEIKNTKEEKNNIKIINKKNKQEQNLVDKKVETILSNLDKNISACKVKRLNLEEDDVFYYIYSSFTIIVYKDNVFATETRGQIDRSVSEVTNENSLKGSKDGFNESYEKNVALIRKRLKSEKLVLSQTKVGKRSQSKIGIMYLSDVADLELVKDVESKIKKINIDAIINSNYILELISNSDETDFPTIITTERPDLASIMLLEGRIVIVVENSPFVLILPTFLIDYINSPSDYFQKNKNVVFTRFVRFIAFIITIITPGLYVALITFNHEAIPSELLLSFSSQRDGVPFPASIEALLMILAFEILREGDYRGTKMSGSTLSVVGALIVGEAAVSAGIVSSIMIIVVAISALSSLIFTDLNTINAVRNWRMIFLLFGGIGGIVGIAVAGMYLLTKICSISSVGYPYTYPLAPANFTKLNNDFLFRKKISNLRNRYKILTNNLTSRR